MKVKVDYNKQPLIFAITYESINILRVEVRIPRISPHKVIKRAAANRLVALFESEQILVKQIDILIILLKLNRKKMLLLDVELL